MAVIRPFECVRPQAEKAERVAALPYDVYNREEACREVAREPLSFLKIDRAETQFDSSVDTYAPEVYAKAKELGCNKIALGHHYDDVIETILMGMLYGAQVQTMMPKLHSTNFEGMELIRPLYLVREDDIKKWRDYNDLHFLQCACKFTETCSIEGGDSSSKRMEIKHLIRDLKKTNPFVEGNIFKSVENVNLSTVIAYKQDGVKHHFLESYDEVAESRDVKQ